MDYVAIAKDVGALPEATEDIVRRCTARFAGEEPSPEAVQQWLRTTLREAAPHLWPEAQPVWHALGLTREQFEAMPPAWRLAQAHLLTPSTTTPHPNRPVYRNLTPEELDSIKDLPFHERHERGRQLQQTPAPSNQG